MTVRPGMKPTDVNLGRNSSEFYRGLRKQVVLGVAETVNCSQSTVREPMVRLQTGAALP